MDLLQFTKENPPPVGTPDAKGTPWDAAKHQAKVHPKTLRWLPRSPGRGHAGQTRLPGVDAPQTTPAASAPSSADPAPDTPAGAAEVKTVSAESLLGLPAAPAAASPNADTPLSSAKPAEAPAAAIADVAPQVETGPAADAPAAGKAVALEATPETDAQSIMAIEALEFITGSFTGEHDEARMEKARRAAMQRMLSRWFAQKGWVAVGGVMLLLFVLSYFLETAKKEKTRAKLREMWGRWWKKKPPEKPAEVLAVETVQPAATPPAAASAAPAPRPFFAQ